MTATARRIATVALVAAFAGAVAALAALPAPDGQIHACYPNKGGNRRAVRLLVDGDCRKRETKLSWSQQGPQGAPGEAGAPGTPGTPGGDGGSSDGTFADTGGWTLVLSGVDQEVANTLQQQPGANGAVGGALSVPANSAFTMIVSVRVQTTGSGAFTCALQSSPDGVGSFFELDRVTQSAGDVLRFSYPSGTFTSQAFSRYFRVVCQGTGRSVQDTQIAAIVSHRAF